MRRMGKVITKRILAFCLVAAVCMMSWTVVPKAEILRDGDYNYKVLADGTVEIEGYSGCDSDIVIPNIIEGKNVTCIGEGAFNSCVNLVSIVIPECVTEIESNAFSRCSGLRGINIPAGVCNIGEDTFSGCSALKSINIPAGVCRIGKGAFSGCNSLEKMEVDEKNPIYYSEENCIVDKNSQRLIAGCKNTIIPENVKSIGDRAFSECSELKYIEIPEGVTSIGEWAFGGCSSLVNADIPSSVTEIAGHAFSGCSGLTSITIPVGVQTIGILSFAYCDNVKSLTIASDLKSIGGSAFWGLTNLEKIEVDKNNAVYYSENNCLIEKDSRKLVRGSNSSVIPADVVSIGAEAFRQYVMTSTL